MRKLCAMFIIFALTLTAVVSCGEKAERVTNVFRAEEIALPDGFSPAGLAFYDGGYAVSAADDNGSKLFRFDGSGLVSETPIESYGENIAAFPDGRVVSAGGDFIEIVSPDGTLETAKLEGLTGGVIDIACADGMMIIASQTSAVVADESGTLLFALPVDIVWSVGQVGGRLVIQGLDRDVMRVNCRYVDPEKKELGEVLDVSGDLLDSPLGLFTKRATGIYDAEGIVCDFLNSDLLGNRLAAIAVLNRDSMLAAVANDNGRTLYRLTRVPENEIVPKKLIRAAGSDISESFLEDAIEFNLEDAEYRIVVDDYSVYNTSDNELAGVEKLKNDIISGYRPDIMVLSTFSPNHTYNNEYRNKNLFADLREFGSDPDFDLDDIPGGILRAGETNGKLLELPLEITSDVLAVKCDLDSWTLREYLDWAKTHEPVLNSVTRGDPVATLYFLLTCSMEEFIDADGDVKFDSELFRDALEYALECEDIEVSDGAVNTNVSATSLCAKKVSLGDDVRFIGYPDSDGNGVRIFMRRSVAIVKDSKVKDGAWRFIKDIAASSWTTENMRANALERLSERIFFFSRDGKSLMSYDRVKTPNPVVDENEFVRRDPSPEVDEELALLDGAKKTIDIDSDLFNLIAEDASAYFAGAKSLDETVKIIQNRVETYIAERN